jgi:hypothetical protein
MPDDAEHVDEIPRIERDLQLRSANGRIDEALAVSTLSGSCRYLDRAGQGFVLARIDRDSHDVVVVPGKVAGTPDGVEQRIAANFDFCVELARDNLAIIRKRPFN